MNNTLDANFENRTAFLDMPYFFIVVKKPDDIATVISHFAGDDVLISIDGLRIDFSMRVDFGKFISDKIWTLFDNSLLDMFPNELKQLKEQAVLEAVKQVYPMVEKSFRDNANRLSESLSIAMSLAGE